MADRVLVTGAVGLLGPYLGSAAAGLGEVVTTSRSGSGGSVACDLVDANATRDLLVEVAPSVVLHAAGMTDVDGCQIRPLQADAANRLSTANLRRYLGPHAALVYVSTDQVYPDVAGPHREGAEAPVNVYGRSKLAGEAEALCHRGSLVLRTNFFGASLTPGRESLSDYFVRKLSARDPFSAYTDVLFSPLHMNTVATMVVEAVKRGFTGVFNLACREGTSKADFALAVAQRLGLPDAGVRATRAVGEPGRTRRPADLRLDVSRAEVAFGRVMPTLTEEVAKL